MKLRVSGADAEGRVSYWMWCPGCDDAVRIDSTWTWDENLDAPTFSPSILTTHNHADGGKRVCHSFLVAGVWLFLGDCTHAMAGQHVPMVDLPDWLAEPQQEATE